MAFEFRRLLPSYWYQNAPTNLKWDATLNEALDRGVDSIGYCVAKVGGIDVWIENWPYAYGSHYRAFDSLDRPLPTIKTRLRLRAAIDDFEQAELRAMFDGIPA